MPSKKIKIASAIAIVLMIVIYIAVTQFKTQEQILYPTYTDAQNGMLKGWISKSLPLSATNIDSLQDSAENSNSKATFSFTPGDDELMRTQCRLLQITKDLEYFLCEDTDCAVIDSKKGKGVFYMWNSEWECVKKKL